MALISVKAIIPDFVDACRVSLRLMGLGPIWVTLIMVGASTCLIALSFPAEAQLNYYLPFLEIGVSIFVSTAITYLLAPESDPAIEVLLTYRRPLAFTRAARLVILVAEVGTVTLVSNLLFLLWIGQWNIVTVLRLFLAWFSPMFFLGGIGLAGTRLGRRAEIGMSAIFVVWGGNLLILALITTLNLQNSLPLAESPLFRVMYLFLTTLTTSAPLGGIWVINRMSMLAVGIVFAALGLNVRNGERALGIDVVEPGQWIRDQGRVQHTYSAHTE